MDQKGFIDRRPPKYLEKILDLAELRGIDLSDGVHHADVWHDDWCAVYSGGSCNCDCVVHIRVDGQRDDA